jgi:hypothetical protein
MLRPLLDKKVRKNGLMIVLLAVMCVMAALVILTASGYANTISDTFEKSYDDLAAQINEYRFRIESLQASVNEKISELAAAKSRIKELEEETSFLKAEKELAVEELEAERRLMRERADGFEKILSELNDRSAEELISQAIEKETDPGARNFLSDVLVRLGLIRSGNSSNSLAAVVPGANENISYPPNGVTSKEAPQSPQFTILTIDRKNNLIAFDGGRRNGLKEGDSLTILKNGREAAVASVISVRYRVASAFVSDTRQDFSFKDISEGDAVVISDN